MRSVVARSPELAMTPPPMLPDIANGSDNPEAPQTKRAPAGNSSRRSLCYLWEITLSIAAQGTVIEPRIVAIGAASLIVIFAEEAECSGPSTGSIAPCCCLSRIRIIFRPIARIPGRCPANNRAEHETARNRSDNHSSNVHQYPLEQDERAFSRSEPSGQMTLPCCVM
jgi:hypothetical protein